MWTGSEWLIGGEHLAAFDESGGKQWQLPLGIGKVQFISPLGDRYVVEGSDGYAVVEVRSGEGVEVTSQRREESGVRDIGRSHGLDSLLLWRRLGDEASDGWELSLLAVDGDGATEVGSATDRSRGREVLLDSAVYVLEESEWGVPGHRLEALAVPSLEPLWTLSSADHGGFMWGDDVVIHWYGPEFWELGKVEILR